MTITAQLRSRGFQENLRNRGRTMEAMNNYGPVIHCLLEELALADLPAELMSDTRETACVSTMDSCQRISRTDTLRDNETQERWTVTRLERHPTLAGCTKLFLVRIENGKDDV